MFPGLDLYYADPAQPLTTAGEELDELDHDLSVRGEFYAVSPKNLTPRKQTKEQPDGQFPWPTLSEKHE